MLWVKPQPVQNFAVTTTLHPIFWPWSTMHAHSDVNTVEHTRYSQERLILFLPCGLDSSSFTGNCAAAFSIALRSSTTSASFNARIMPPVTMAAPRAVTAALPATAWEHLWSLEQVARKWHLHVSHWCTSCRITGMSELWPEDVSVPLASKVHDSSSSDYVVLPSYDHDNHT